MNITSFQMQQVFGAIIGACLILSPDVVGADEYGDLPKTFFELVAKGDIGAGVDYLGGTNPKMDQDSVGELRRKLVKLLAEFGAYTFHEKLDEVKYGSRFVRLTYILGYENFPLQVTITLYQPKDKWVFFGITYSTTSDGAFTSLPRK